MAPSLILGLTPGSYEAYCLDQAIWFMGSQITHELDQVGHKKQRGEAAQQAARKRKLDTLLGVEDKGSGFADPAALFTQG